jgi:hypothetical protein
VFGIVLQTPIWHTYKQKVLLYLRD